MRQPRLLDVTRDRIWVRHFSHETETVYLRYAYPFAHFHSGCHPWEISGPDIMRLLSYIAVVMLTAPSSVAGNGQAGHIAEAPKDKPLSSWSLHPLFRGNR